MIAANNELLAMMSTFKNILLIKWGALGDILTVTIALKALRARYPEAKLTLLTNRIGCEIFANDDGLHEIYDHQQLEQKRGKLGLITFLRQLHFDLAINFRWYSLRCAMIAHFSAKKAAGYGPRFCRFLYHYKADLLPANTPSLEYSIIAAHTSAVGCKQQDLQGYLPLSRADKAFAASFYDDNNLDPNNTLLLAPGASNRCKCWPIENFIAVCQQFKQAFPTTKVLLNWMPGDEDIIAKCQRALPDLVLQPKTTIGQVCALVEKATLILCNNSGLMNVAYMLQKPLVCINTAHHWTLVGENIVSINAFAKDKQGQHCTPTTEADVLAVLRTIQPIAVSQPLHQLWHQVREKYV